MASICSSAAADGAKLVVQLAATDHIEPTAPIEVPLGNLSGEFVNKQLDSSGNRLLLMRAPGDSLRISLARDSLVFGPGEVLKATLEPHALPLPEGGRARLKIQLLGGGKEFWSQQRDVQAGMAMKIPLEIPLPSEEGVYEIVIVAVNNPPWSQAVRQPLDWKRTIAERRVQLLVLGPQRLAGERFEREFTQVVEIDPANPRWYEKFNKLPQWSLTKARLPRLWKGPLGNDCFQTRPHASLGELAELSPNANSPDVSWKAYWLPIAQPGRPHILEVDYPSDVSQSLGISIVEPNAAGALMPIGLDSGLDRSAEAVSLGAAPCWQRHRLIFWPRTASPLLLVDQRPRACAGRVRQDSRAGGGRAIAAGAARAERANGAVAGRLSRPPPDPRKLLGRTMPRRLERPQSGRLADLLPRADAAGRISQPRRLQRADARRVGRRQHDLSQQAACSPRRVTIPARSSPRPKTPSARTCWRCCCGCSTARSCG